MNLFTRSMVLAHKLIVGTTLLVLLLQIEKIIHNNINTYIMK